MTIPSVGTTVWCIFVALSFYIRLRSDDPLWLLGLRAAQGLFTVMLIGSGQGLPFFVINTLTGVLNMLVMGGSLLVMPPPLAREMGAGIALACCSILIAALCWALG